MGRDRDAEDESLALKLTKKMICDSFFSTKTHWLYPNFLWEWSLGCFTSSATPRNCLGDPWPQAMLVTAGMRNLQCPEVSWNCDLWAWDVLAPFLGGQKSSKFVFWVPWLLREYFSHPLFTLHFWGVCGCIPPPVLVKQDPSREYRMRYRMP